MTASEDEIQETKDIVAALETVLKRAKAGEVMGIAAVLLIDNGKDDVVVDGVITGGISDILVQGLEAISKIVAERLAASKTMQ